MDQSILTGNLGALSHADVAVKGAVVEVAAETGLAGCLGAGNSVRPLSFFVGGFVFDGGAFAVDFNYLFFGLRGRAFVLILLGGVLRWGEMAPLVV